MLDVVRGTIVGGNFVAWQLFYDNRPQDQKQYSDTDDEAIARSKAIIADWRSKWGDEFNRLYPDSSKWECRIWN